MTSLRGPGERNFNAVSRKPTRAPIQFNSIQSVPVSFGLWDTALKFLSPGPRSDVTDHLAVDDSYIPFRVLPSLGISNLFCPQNSLTYSCHLPVVLTELTEVTCPNPVVFITSVAWESEVLRIARKRERVLSSSSLSPCHYPFLPCHLSFILTTQTWV